MATRLEDLVVRSYALGMIGALTITLERVQRHDGPDRWAIRDGALCLNGGGQWEYEPLPSSRTPEFLLRCRFDSIDAALTIWDAFRGTGR